MWGGSESSAIVYPLGYLINSGVAKWESSQCTPEFPNAAFALSLSSRRDSASDQFYISGKPFHHQRHFLVTAGEIEKSKIEIGCS